MTTIAHISDLHFGRIDLNVAETLVVELTALKPDLVVVSGDLTQRARPAQYQAAKVYLDRLPKPQLAVPGNHDVPLYDVFRRWLRPHERFAQYICSDPYPTWKNQDAIVVGINTACRFTPRLRGFWKDGKIRAEHVQELRARFTPRAIEDRTTRILVAHHPFIEPDGAHRHGIIHGAIEGLRQLDELQIDLILSGHLHQSVQTDVRLQHPFVKRQIVNLLAGSATSTRRREAFFAYNVIRIEDGKWSATVRKFTESAWQ